MRPTEPGRLNRTLSAGHHDIETLVNLNSSIYNICGQLTEHFCACAQMIDEVHTLIGAGAAEGAIDAANILKPALARGELQCIGATTLDEYRKHIEKDPALERRFQPVKISSLPRTCKS